MDGAAAALQALVGRVPDPALLSVQPEISVKASSQEVLRSADSNSSNNQATHDREGVRIFSLHEPAHREQAKNILAIHFEESSDLTSKAIDFSHGVCDPNTGKSNDYLVFGCTDKNNEVQAVAVCVVRALPRHGLKVLEIVWYGALVPGKGWGSMFFTALVALAKTRLGVDAILSTSTNAALSFWLSRPNVRIVSTVLRASKRNKITSLVQGFKVAPAPVNSVMARLYTEEVMRNKKGRLVSQFDGRPYQYCVETSNHVWYVLNPKLSIPTRIHKRAL